MGGKKKGDVACAERCIHLLHTHTRFCGMSNCKTKGCKGSKYTRQVQELEKNISPDSRTASLSVREEAGGGMLL